MKKINLLTVIMAVAMFAVSFGTATAQDKKAKDYIENFTQGRKLNKADIKFLNGITNGKADAKEATVAGKKYKEGQTLSADDATAINKAKADYRKDHKMAKATDAKKIDKTRGNENCYWYLYCDGYGNCYYVWYCD